MLVEIVLTEHLRPLSLLVANSLNLFADGVECLLIFSVLSVALALSIICIDESTQSLEFTLGSSELLEHIGSGRSLVSLNKCQYSIVCLVETTYVITLVILCTVDALALGLILVEVVDSLHILSFNILLQSVELTVVVLRLFIGNHLTGLEGFLDICSDARKTFCLSCTEKGIKITITSVICIVSNTIADIVLLYLAQSIFYSISNIALTIRGGICLCSEYIVCALVFSSDLGISLKLINLSGDITNQFVPCVLLGSHLISGFKLLCNVCIVNTEISISLKHCFNICINSIDTCILSSVDSVY